MNETAYTDRCFACDKIMSRSSHLVDTRDAQTVYVGPDCNRRIEEAGDQGWQPTKGGPRLYPLNSNKEDKR